VPDLTLADEGFQKHRVDRETMNHVLAKMKDDLKPRDPDWS